MNKNEVFLSLKDKTWRKQVNSGKDRWSWVVLTGGGLMSVEFLPDGGLTYRANLPFMPGERYWDFDEATQRLLILGTDHQVMEELEWPFETDEFGHEKIQVVGKEVLYLWIPITDQDQGREPNFMLAQSNRILTTEIDFQQLKQTAHERRLSLRSIKGQDTYEKLRNAYTQIQHHHEVRRFGVALVDVALNDELWPVTFDSEQVTTAVNANGEVVWLTGLRQAMAILLAEVLIRYNQLMIDSPDAEIDWRQLIETSDGAGKFVQVESGH